ncbi:MAG: aspartate ammonia-lyase [Burkholderiales bacterium]|nr:aspartate ammonia-lyase [Burkholderiales bacterium]
MSPDNAPPGNARTESDHLGTVPIAAHLLYGVNTSRALRNFAVSGRRLSDEPEFVKAFAQCKWAAARANAELGAITPVQADAIADACAEIVDGKLHEHMVVDLLEGSGGTSTNMNVNEVIANRAEQRLGGEPGRYSQVHPNDHVNRSQSTNDVYPAAMKIAAHAMLGPLIDEVSALAGSLSAKAAAFATILHLGRTCLQDAQPMTLGQAFGGYAALAARLADSLARVREQLLALPLGGTAIGTGFGSPAGYRTCVLRHLASITGTSWSPPQDAFDAMQNLDVFCRVSAELRTCATSLAKVASDLIVLSSGPRGGIAEIELPAVQAGSSIMPGKINPVLPMSIVQIGFAVAGNDTCIAQANLAGQLEINHFEPVVADRLFDSIRLLRNGVRLFHERCIDGIRADAAANERNLMASTAIATALVPRLGYSAVSAIVREAHAAGRSLCDELDGRGILDAAEARRQVRASTETRF